MYQNQNYNPYPNNQAKQDFPQNPQQGQIYGGYQGQQQPNYGVNQQYPGQYQQGGVYQQEMVQIQMPNNQFYQQQQVPIQQNSLQSAPGIVVQKQLNLLEVISDNCCEIENQYWVDRLNPNTVQAPELKGSKQFILKVSEKSSWCARHFCAGSCRPYTLKVQNFISDNVILKAKREFSCTFCCLNRPVLEVRDSNGNVFGTITNDFSCTEMKFTIRDGNGNLKYTVIGDACQCKFFFRFSCYFKSCQTFNYQVQDASGNVITQFYRNHSGCSCKEYYNQMSTVFPQTLPESDRLLWMFCMLFIDFQFFEQGPMESEGGDN